MEPMFFPRAADFREWLDANHATAAELLVGFYKKDGGRPSLTWPESVDEALCYGWIDGVRRAFDSDSYTIRFTPRRRRSIWSAINTKRAAELTALGLMTPAGLAAFAARAEANSGIYSFERRQEARLPDSDEARFRGEAAAWAFFQAQPPGYRRTVTWWVVSARREETRLRRLARLIEECAAGRKIDLMAPMGRR